MMDKLEKVGDETTEGDVSLEMTKDDVGKEGKEKAPFQAFSFQVFLHNQHRWEKERECRKTAIFGMALVHKRRRDVSIASLGPRACFFAA